MNTANRVIANTAVSYISLIVRMILGFFTVRFVLSALGESDYGVYIIVAGVVGMLDILNSNMSNTSMRFLAHSLGSNNQDKIIRTFTTTVYIHYFVAILSVMVLELGGWCMFELLLNIPEDRLYAAHIIFQFMVATTFITIIAVPYDAVMNAHEHIYILSLFDIISGILSFCCAILLMRIRGDRLVIYGLYLFLIQILLRILKVSFAKRKYNECRIVKKSHFRKDIFKEILSFTGWNLFGSLAALGSGQLRSLIVNSFFGVKLNAAEGVANQAAGPVNNVVSSMTRAINPQIMKSEGGGEHNKMLYIVEIGAKYSSFLFALLGIPLLFELPMLLDLWLDEVPESAVVFCRLVLISMLLEKFTFQITHAIRAVGKIKNFQICESLACLVYLPFAYLAFKNGMPPETIYCLAICTNILTAIVRVFFGHTVAGINVVSYVKNAIVSVIVPIMIASIAIYYFDRLVPVSYMRIVSTFGIYWLIYLPSFWFIGLNRIEHDRWKRIAKVVVSRIF